MKRAAAHVAILLVVWTFSSSLRSHAADDSLQQEAQWALADDARIAETMRSGLTEQGLDPAKLAAALASLGEMMQANEADRLDMFMEASVAALPKLADKLQQIERSPGAIGDDPFIAFAPSVRDQARLWAGRALVRVRLFDEALPLMQSLDPIDVVAPAELLFYRGACYHALLKKDEAIEDLTALLQRKEQIPQRFTRTAELMLADIEPLKEDSLDEIARLMNDVSRRLDLGRSGDPVVEREQQIIDKLDKMIEKMEEQQKQQQQQMQQAQSGSQGGSQSKAMEDSQIAGGSGPGDIDRKKLGDRDGWGNLPPAQRQEALQKISQDLPTHYREAIEAYFRKLATEKR
ncbi:hypothetical protein Poly24_20660 [Rosistilla carotiformis]|uniref:Tetratricopeptide repeat protein n=1 Tax=Rosistilla carotiformis TaxID=2528017 RepID=A0A518JS52_9BACT|nr:hypothetical protein [Rosistilla carotiformis]QDV68357.1 hypothetical protein Poly24_20660 [Rosistilla carotiformis]